MKRVIKAASQDLPKSKYFELVEESGTSIYGQPWRHYNVISKDLAKKHVVEVRLDYFLDFYQGDDEEELQKEVSPEKYTGCEVAWGMRMKRNTDEDVQEMISVLNDALSFENQLRRFFDFD